MEGGRQVRISGLGEHDRKEDQDADGTEVDEHLRRRDDRGTEQGVHPGQGAEADHHRDRAVDDVAQRDDQQPGTDHADGEQDEEDAGEVQGNGS